LSPLQTIKHVPTASGQPGFAHHKVAISARLWRFPAGFPFDSCSSGLAQQLEGERRDREADPPVGLWGTQIRQDYRLAIPDVGEADRSKQWVGPGIAHR